MDVSASADLIFGIPVRINGDDDYFGPNDITVDITKVIRKFQQDEDDNDYEGIIDQESDCPLGIIGAGAYFGESPSYILSFVSFHSWEVTKIDLDALINKIDQEKINEAKEWFKQNELEWVEPSWWLCASMG